MTAALSAIPKPASKKPRPPGVISASRGAPASAGHAIEVDTKQEEPIYDASCPPSETASESGSSRMGKNPLFKLRSGGSLRNRFAPKLPLELEASPAEKDDMKRSPSNAISNAIAGTITNALQTDASSGKLHDEYVRQLWVEAVEKGNTDFFGHDNIRMVHDGGLRDVSKLDYPFQYMKALLVAATTIFNVFLIVHLDLSQMFRKSNEGDQKFLITKWFIGSILDLLGSRQVFEERFERRGVRLFSAVELLVLLLMLARTFWRIAQVLVADMVWEPHDAKRNRWVLLSRLFRYNVQEIRYYSGMRLLYYLTPTVFSTDACLIFLHVRQRLQAHRSRRLQFCVASGAILRFTLSRFLALVIGIDAFFMKFRIVRDDLDLSHNRLAASAVWSSLGFIYQLLGVVSVARFIRERLLIFVFGGEDGNLDCDEEALVEVWFAVISKEVYETFGFWRGTLVLLGYDDYDFQLLVLDDDEYSIRLHGSASSKPDSYAQTMASQIEATPVSEPQGLKMWL